MAVVTRLIAGLVIALPVTVVAQQVQPPPDTMVRLERTGCFGACPIYTITIDARGTVTFARRLIDGGADPGGPDHRSSPLASARSRSMVELLLQAGADPNERSGGVAARTPLMPAADRNPEVAQSLVEAGAHLEDVDDTGLTALGYAACAGHWRVVAALLRAGANPRGSIGKTSAIVCARTARDGEAGRLYPVAGPGQPTVEDFDNVIALLEEAESRRKRLP